MPDEKRRQPQSRSLALVDCGFSFLGCVEIVLGWVYVAIAHCAVDKSVLE